MGVYSNKARGGVRYYKDFLKLTSMGDTLRILHFRAFLGIFRLYGGKILKFTPPGP